MWKFCKLWLHWLFSGLCHFIVIAILTKGKKKRLAASAALQSALITSKISCRRSLQAAGRRMRGPQAKGQTRAENLSGEIVGIRNLETIKVLDIRLQKSIENSFKEQRTLFLRRRSLSQFPHLGGTLSHWLDLLWLILDLLWLVWGGSVMRQGW